MSAACTNLRMMIKFEGDDEWQLMKMKHLSGFPYCFSIRNGFTKEV